MYYTAAMALVPPHARGDLVWEVAQRLAGPAKGSFDALLLVDAPPEIGPPLERIFEGVDSDQTRLVVLDSRRWTLLNGRDSVSRDDITALLGLGANALRVDNAASCVIACVNTQRRETALKRAAEVLAWRQVISQLTEDTEDELSEATRSHEDLMTKLRRDVARAFQHYAYLVRAEGQLHVEYKRFDEDNRTALNGGHVWAALVADGRATTMNGLSANYLEALLDGFDRQLTPRKIVQAFYKNPAFPLITSTDEVRRVLFELLSSGGWQLVDVDDNPLAITSAGQISIGSISQRLRRTPAERPGDSADSDTALDDPQGPHATPPTEEPTDAGAQIDERAPASPVYKRYRIQLTNKSITGADARDETWQLLREIAKVVDTATTADHQLLTLDLIFVTAEGDQGAIEQKATAIGGQVHIEDDDF